MQSGNLAKATTSTALKQSCLKDIILEWDSSQGCDPVIKALSSQEVVSDFFHDLEKDPNQIQVGIVSLFYSRLTFLLQIIRKWGKIRGLFVKTGDVNPPALEAVSERGRKILVALDTWCKRAGDAHMRACM